MDLSWRYSLKNIFIRNKTFLFFKIENWNFQHLFEIKFREASQNFNSFSLFRQLLFNFFSINCLIKLKFCEVSQNPFSNRLWKFQLSILKNKKILVLKKNSSYCQYQNSKPIFSEGFESRYQKRRKGGSPLLISHRKRKTQYTLGQ